MSHSDNHGFAVENTARLFTIRDVATLAGVSIMSVRRWIDHHGLQVHRFGRLVRISQADLDAFFARKRDNSEISYL